MVQEAKDTHAPQILRRTAHFVWSSPLTRQHKQKKKKSVRQMTQNCPYVDMIAVTKKKKGPQKKRKENHIRAGSSSLSFLRLPLSHSGTRSGSTCHVTDRRPTEKKTASEFMRGKAEGGRKIERETERQQTSHNITLAPKHVEITC